MHKMRLYAITVLFSMMFTLLPILSHGQTPDITPIPTTSPMPTSAAEPTSSQTQPTLTPADPESTAVPTQIPEATPTDTVPVEISPTVSATPSASLPTPTETPSISSSSSSSSHKPETQGAVSEQTSSSSSSQESSNENEGPVNTLAESIREQFHDLTSSVGTGLVREKPYGYYDGQYLVSKQTSDMILSTAILFMATGLFTLKARSVFAFFNRYTDRLREVLPFEHFHKKQSASYERTS